MTESTLLEDSQAVAHLDSLREIGVRIGVDDFGTGYSSLTYLHRFPVNMVKIAREFVGSGSHEAPGMVLAGAIVALGNALRLDVVAEGIEDEAQTEALRRLGCELGQGFLYAKPVTDREVHHLLEWEIGNGRVIPVERVRDPFEGGLVR